MKELSLVFPHQLFDPHPALAPGRPVALIEDSLFFGDRRYPLNFHKKKLLLHVASMDAYATRLEKKGFAVERVPYDPKRTAVDVIAAFAKKGVRAFHAADVVDDVLARRLDRAVSAAGAVLHRYETPMFLTPRRDVDAWFEGRRRLLMADFYVAQRKRLGVLIDADGKPAGGRWSFDAENRRRAPKGLSFPRLSAPLSPVSAAAAAVNKRFPQNRGSTDGFWFPVTHEAARRWLDEFLEERFERFGDYEDAIVRDETVLFHSVLTPALNIGLLTPKLVLDRTLAFAAAEKIPLNSLEGFVRQIMGWREFMRGVYVAHGARQRNGNFWNHERELPAGFEDGRTGLEPLDVVLRRVKDNAWCHHIERLMVLGSFFVMGGYHPHAVYRFFMENFIDAYDWVMVPNVYGMSQFADGGLFATKPYISGSNYLRKMSDFKPGPWVKGWDDLFWGFVSRHRRFFEANPRLSVIAKQVETRGAEWAGARESAARALIEELPAAIASNRELV